MQSLVFTKYSSTCLPIAHYNSEDLCENQGFKVFTSVSAVLKGMYGLYSEERDNAIVESALKTMLHPYVVSKMNIVVEDENFYSLGTTEDVKIRAEVEFDSTVNEISVSELDWLHNFETALMEKFGYYDDNNLIASVLSSAAHDLLGMEATTVMSGASFESHITNIQLINAEPKKRKIYHDRVRTYKPTSEETPQITAVTTATTKIKLDHAQQLEYDILNAEAIAGYVVMCCVIVAVGLVSWRQNVKRDRLRENQSLSAPLSTDENLLRQSEWRMSSSSMKKKKVSGGDQDDSIA